LTHFNHSVPFRWDFAAGVAALCAAVLCVVPTVGAALAWQMQVDLLTFTRFAVLPALLLLGVCELYLVKRHPDLFNRLASGLVGGLLATLALDAVRLPAAYVFHWAPDFVPQFGQMLLGETAGISPSFAAIALGYGYSYLLMGALLGGAYALVIGRGHWWGGLVAGAAMGLMLTALPQFQLIAVAMGFDLPTACAVDAGALALAGLFLGSAVQRLGRTRANVLRIVFLRESAVELVS
jgi:hypothetical protein